MSKARQSGDKKRKESPQTTAEVWKYTLFPEQRGFYDLNTVDPMARIINRALFSKKHELTGKESSLVLNIIRLTRDEDAAAGIMGSLLRTKALSDKIGQETRIWDQFIQELTNEKIAEVVALIKSGDGTDIDAVLWEVAKASVKIRGIEIEAKTPEGKGIVKVQAEEDLSGEFEKRSKKEDLDLGSAIESKRQDLDGYVKAEKRFEEERRSLEEKQVKENDAFAQTEEQVALIMEYNALYRALDDGGNTAITGQKEMLDVIDKVQAENWDAVGEALRRSDNVKTLANDLFGGMNEAEARSYFLRLVRSFHSDKYDAGGLNEESRKNIEEIRQYILAAHGYYNNRLKAQAFPSDMENRHLEVLNGILDIMDERGIEVASHADFDAIADLLFNESVLERLNVEVRDRGNEINRLEEEIDKKKEQENSLHQAALNIQDEINALMAQQELGTDAKGKEQEEVLPADGQRKSSADYQQALAQEKAREEQRKDMEEDAEFKVLQAAEDALKAKGSAGIKAARLELVKRYFEFRVLKGLGEGKEAALGLSEIQSMMEEELGKENTPKADTIRAYLNELTSEKSGFLSKEKKSGKNIYKMRAGQTGAEKSKKELVLARSKFSVDRDVEDIGSALDNFESAKDHIEDIYKRGLMTRVTPEKRKTLLKRAYRVIQSARSNLDKSEAILAAAMEKLKKTEDPAEAARLTAAISALQERAAKLDKEYKELMFETKTNVENLRLSLSLQERMKEREESSDGKMGTEEMTSVELLFSEKGMDTKVTEGNKAKTSDLYLQGMNQAFTVCGLISTLMKDASEKAEELERTENLKKKKALQEDLLDLQKQMLDNLRSLRGFNFEGKTRDLLKEDALKPVRVYVDQMFKVLENDKTGLEKQEELDEEIDLKIFSATSEKIKADELLNEYKDQIDGYKEGYIELLNRPEVLEYLEKLRDPYGETRQQAARELNEQADVLEDMIRSHFGEDVTYDKLLIRLNEKIKGNYIDEAIKDMVILSLVTTDSSHIIKGTGADINKLLGSLESGGELAAAMIALQEKNEEAVQEAARQLGVDRSLMEDLVSRDKNKSTIAARSIAIKMAKGEISGAKMKSAVKVIRRLTLKADMEDTLEENKDVIEKVFGDEKDFLDILSGEDGLDKVTRRIEHAIDQKAVSDDAGQQFIKTLKTSCVEAIRKATVSESTVHAVLSSMRKHVNDAFVRQRSDILNQQKRLAVDEQAEDKSIRDALRLIAGGIGSYMGVASSLRDKAERLTNEDSEIELVSDMEEIWRGKFGVIKQNEGLMADELDRMFNEIGLKYKVKVRILKIYGDKALSEEERQDAVRDLVDAGTAARIESIFAMKRVLREDTGIASSAERMEIIRADIEQSGLSADEKAKLLVLAEPKVRLTAADLVKTSAGEEMIFKMLEKGTKAHIDRRSLRKEIKETEFELKVAQSDPQFAEKQAELEARLKQQKQALGDADVVLKTMAMREALGDAGTEISEEELKDAIIEDRLEDLVKKKVPQYDREDVLKRIAAKRQQLKDGSYEMLNSLALSSMLITVDTGMVIPYREQIAATIAMSSGKRSIAQLLTGEGKTYVGQMCAYVQCLGETAIYVDTQDILSERNYHLAKPTMERVGLKVGRISKEMSNTEKKEEYAKNIVFAAIDSLAFDVLNDQDTTESEKQNRQVRERLEDLKKMNIIVDEIDSILIDQALTSFIQVKGRGEVDLESLTRILAAQLASKDVVYDVTETVKETEVEKVKPGTPTKKEGSIATVDRVNKHASIYGSGRIDSLDLMKKQLGTDDHKTAIRRQLSRKGIKASEAQIDEEIKKVTAKIDEEIAFLREQKNNGSKGETAIQDRIHKGESYVRLMQDAISATHAYKDGVDYAKNSGEVILIQQMTGVQSGGQRLHGSEMASMHQLLEAKEDLLVKGEGKSSGEISARQLFRRVFNNVSGMTGTPGRGEEVKALVDFYGFSTDLIPAHFARRRVDIPKEMMTSEQDMMDKVISDLVEAIVFGRQTLLAVDNVAQADYMQKVLMERKAEITEKIQTLHEEEFGQKLEGFDLAEKMQLYTAREQEDKDAIQARASEAGMITIATAISGRGTDLAIHELSKEKGMQVISLALNTSQRVEQQLRGRTGRQGKAGDTRIYLTLDPDSPFSVLSMFDTAISRADSKGFKGRKIKEALVKSKDNYKEITSGLRSKDSQIQQARGVISDEIVKMEAELSGIEEGEAAQKLRKQITALKNRIRGTPLTREEKIKFELDLVEAGRSNAILGAQLSDLGSLEKEREILYKSSEAELSSKIVEFDAAFDLVQQMYEDKFIEQIRENGKKGDLKFDLLNRIRDEQNRKTKELLKIISGIKAPESVMEFVNNIVDTSNDSREIADRMEEQLGTPFSTDFVDMLRMNENGQILDIGGKGFRGNLAGAVTDILARESMDDQISSIRKEFFHEMSLATGFSASGYFAWKKQKKKSEDLCGDAIEEISEVRVTSSSVAEKLHRKVKEAAVKHAAKLYYQEQIQNGRSQILKDNAALVRAEKKYRSLDINVEGYSDAKKKYEALLEKRMQRLVEMTEHFNELKTLDNPREAYYQEEINDANKEIAVISKELNIATTKAEAPEQTGRLQEERELVGWEKFAAKVRKGMGLGVKMVQVTTTVNAVSSSQMKYTSAQAAEILARRRNAARENGALDNVEMSEAVDGSVIVAGASNKQIADALNDVRMEGRVSPGGIVYVVPPDDDDEMAAKNIDEFKGMVNLNKLTQTASSEGKIAVVVFSSAAEGVKPAVMLLDNNDLDLLLIGLNEKGSAVGLDVLLSDSRAEEFGNVNVGGTNFVFATSKGFNREEKGVKLIRKASGEDEALVLSGKDRYITSLAARAGISANLDTGVITVGAGTPPDEFYQNLIDRGLLSPFSVRPVAYKSIYAKVVNGFLGIIGSWFESKPDRKGFAEETERMIAGLRGNIPESLSGIDEANVRTQVGALVGKDSSEEDKRNALIELLRVARDNDKIDEFGEEFSSLVESVKPKGDPLISYVQARTYDKRGEYGKAAALYRKALIDRKTYNKSQLALAEIYSREVAVKDIVKGYGVFGWFSGFLARGGSKTIVPLVFMTALQLVVGPFSTLAIVMAVASPFLMDLMSAVREKTGKAPSKGFLGIGKTQTGPTIFEKILTAYNGRRGRRILMDLARRKDEDAIASILVADKSKLEGLQKELEMASSQAAMPKEQLEMMRQYGMAAREEKEIQKDIAKEEKVLKMADAFRENAREVIDEKFYSDDIGFFKDLAENTDSDKMRQYAYTRLGEIDDDNSEYYKAKALEAEDKDAEASEAFKKAIEGVEEKKAKLEEELSAAKADAERYGKMLEGIGPDDVVKDIESPEWQNLDKDFKKAAAERASIRKVLDMTRPEDLAKELGGPEWQRLRAALDKAQKKKDELETRRSEIDKALTEMEEAIKQRDASRGYRSEEDQKLLESWQKGSVDTADELNTVNKEVTAAKTNLSRYEKFVPGDLSAKMKSAEEAYVAARQRLDEYERAFTDAAMVKLAESVEKIESVGLALRKMEDDGASMLHLARIAADGKAGNYSQMHLEKARAISDGIISVEDDKKVDRLNKKIEEENKRIKLYTTRKRASSLSAAKEAKRKLEEQKVNRKKEIIKEELQLALMAKEDNYEARYELARNYEENGRLDKAQSHYIALIGSGSPEEPKAREALVLLVPMLTDEAKKDLLNKIISDRNMFDAELAAEEDMVNAVIADDPDLQSYAVDKVKEIRKRNLLRNRSEVLKDEFGVEIYEGRGKSLRSIRTDELRSRKQFIDAVNKELRLERRLPSSITYLGKNLETLRAEAIDRGLEASEVDLMLKRTAKADDMIAADLESKREALRYSKMIAGIKRVPLKMEAKENPSDPEEEIEALEIGYMNEPVAEVYTAISEIYLDIGNIERAKRYLEACVKAYPSHAPAYIKLAELYKSEKEFVLALDLLDHALIADNKNTEALIMKGELAAFQSRMDTAIESYEAAIENGSKDLKAYNALEELYVMLGRQSNIENFYFKKAEAYLEQKKYDRAIVLFDKVIDSENTEEDLRQRARFGKAKAFAGKKEYKIAVEEVRQIQKEGFKTDEIKAFIAKYEGIPSGGISAKEINEIKSAGSYEDLTRAIDRVLLEIESSPEEEEKWNKEIAGLYLARAGVRAPGEKPSEYVERRGEDIKSAVEADAKLEVDAKKMIMSWNDGSLEGLEKEQRKYLTRIGQWWNPMKMFSKDKSDEIMSIRLRNAALGIEVFDSEKDQTLLAKAENDLLSVRETAMAVGKPVPSSWQTLYDKARDRKAEVSAPSVEEEPVAIIGISSGDFEALNALYPDIKFISSASPTDMVNAAEAAALLFVDMSEKDINANIDNIVKQARMQAFVNKFPAIAALNKGTIKGLNAGEIRDVSDIVTASIPDEAAFSNNIDALIASFTAMPETAKDESDVRQKLASAAEDMQALNEAEYGSLIANMADAAGSAKGRAIMGVVNNIAMAASSEDEVTAQLRVLADEGVVTGTQAIVVDARGSSGLDVASMIPSLKSLARKDKELVRVCVLTDTGTDMSMLDDTDIIPLIAPAEDISLAEYVQTELRGIEDLQDITLASISIATGENMLQNIESHIKANGTGAANFVIGGKPDDDEEMNREMSRLIPILAASALLDRVTNDRNLPSVAAIGCPEAAESLASVLKGLIQLVRITRINIGAEIRAHLEAILETARSM